MDLSDLEGNAVDLASLGQGKALLLHVWNAGLAPAEEDLAQIRQFRKEAYADDWRVATAVIGLTASETRHWKKHLEVEWTVVLDSADWRPDYGLETAGFFQIDPEGRLVAALPGLGTPALRALEKPFPYLGIRFRKAGEGLVVEKVYPGGRAEKGGLFPEDIIRKVGGKAVQRPEALADAVQFSHPDSLLQITVMRGREELRLAL